MQGVGNSLSPKKAAISLNYLMGAYNPTVSSIGFLFSGASITIRIAKGLEELEPYYARIDQDYRSYGEDSLLPCMRDSIPEIQRLIQCLGVNQLWRVRLRGKLEDVAEFLFKISSFPYLGQVTGVFWIQEFCFLLNVSLCAMVDVTEYLPTGPFANSVQAIVRPGYRRRIENRAGWDWSLRRLRE